MKTNVRLVETASEGGAERAATDVQYAKTTEMLNCIEFSTSCRCSDSFPSRKILLRLPVKSLGSRARSPSWVPKPAFRRRHFEPVFDRRFSSP